MYDGIYGKDKYTLFKVMLHDLNVSPFSTWEKEFPLMSREDRFDSMFYEKNCVLCSNALLKVLLR